MAAQSAAPSLMNRMVRAIRLDTHVYEEVERDQGATGQAAAVVVIASVIGGIGFLTAGGILGLVVGIVLNLAGWAIWAWLNYVIGAKMLPEKQTEADWGQLARAMGFAYSPRVFLIFGLIPGITPFVGLAVAVWTLVGMVLAIRTALDYTSTLRAVMVTLIGFLINAVAVAVIAALLPRAGGAS